MLKIRNLLGILGADPNQDPEPLSFVSPGEGAKQHNIGKVYPGLYVFGHAVPYLVVVKVGKPNERLRPGKHGNGGPQMVVMYFLNKVCGFRSSMTLCLPFPFLRSNSMRPNLSEMFMHTPSLAMAGRLSLS